MRPVIRSGLPAVVLMLMGVPGPAPVHGQERGQPFLRSELVFPLDVQHNHASCVVECPNGDLLVTWYRGSGERTADDVRILGARMPKGGAAWTEPFVMADVPGFPDCNPCMVVDPRGTLWLFWPTIIANQWHTAMLMARTSTSFQGSDPPAWSEMMPVYLKPGAEFPRVVQAKVQEDLKRVDTFPVELRERLRGYLELRSKNSADKYFNRMGWMPRAHPFILEGKRLIVPLYSDGFDFSLMAYTDDWGKNWSVSAPLVSDGGVQPSIVRKKDGTLATYMRDNGGPPKRVLMSESKDRGETWSPVRDTEIPNPGSGAEVIGLTNGHWALINNDTERGRHSLAVSISDDEGKTWRWTRHLERDLEPQGPATGGYPSLLQAADGTLHATYTFNPRARDVKQDAQGRGLRASIKHAHFNEAWVVEQP